MEYTKKGKRVDSIYSGLFILGLALVVTASLFMRSKTAPATGAGPFCWPWQAKDRYTPRGFQLFILGCTFWAVAAILAGVLLAT